MAPLAALRRRWPAAMLAIALVTGGPAAAGPAAIELSFAPPPGAEAPPPGWRDLTFKKIARHTRYTVVPEGEGWVLRADSDRSASGLYRPLDADARVHRVLAWRWKIAGVVAGADARTKAGDDYAARVYVAFRYDPRHATVWERTTYGLYRTLYGEYPPAMVLNYVWDNRLPAGTVLDNAYTGRAKIVVVRSGDADAGRWVAERRDVHADYTRIVGGEPPAIAGIAVMTDTDDTGGRATAWYDTLRLSAE